MATLIAMFQGQAERASQQFRQQDRDEEKKKERQKDLTVEKCKSQMSSLEVAIDISHRGKSL